MFKFSLVHTKVQPEIVCHSAIYSFIPTKPWIMGMLQSVKIAGAWLMVEQI